MPENEEEVQTETVESVEAPQSSEDVWSKEIDFTPKDEVETVEGSPIETPSEKVEEKVEEKAEKVEETSVSIEAKEDEEKEDEVNAESDIPRLSRRKLRDLETSVIQPFRDPDTPITEVLKGLSELNPTRASELLTEVAHTSAEKFPNEWLAVITGIEGITKEQVIEKFSGTETPTAEKEYETELKAAIASLDDVYPNWRESDEDLIDSDKPLVNFIRSQLDAPKQTEKETALESKVSELTEKLNSLTPKIDEFENAQKTELEKKVNESYLKSFDDYRQSVEGDIKPKFLEENGLTVTDSDPPEIKDFKEAVLARFEPQDGYMSDFDMFALNKFSDAQKMAKIVQRVDKNLKEAARLEATREKDEKKAKENLAHAQSLRSDADNDKDVLKVLNKKAMKEFADTPQIKALVNVLEINSNLRRQLAQITGGRVEIVGNNAVSASDDWKEKIRQSGKEKGTVWNADILDERLAGMAR